MSEDFLGTGWRFPIMPDEAGRLEYAAGEQSIEHCLRALLLTATGERVMRPDFGTRAQESVFAPGGVQSLRDLENSIVEAVRAHEPRVELEEVRAETDPADASRVTVSVTYRIRRGNTKANLVFPYYLGLTGSTP
ncbi:baseplate protein [Sphaerisporangium siamense]|uniref:Phage baseplate assembly protein W n=1 Tax=Sphaerisporangium siamense TaxID=795645 RepID=A0A7W7D7R3_9ACTN|nr:GPW/gp25 family protein [Sphaerisporangium siamense]MBB4701848.1 phage baseplate assembly protein W [Sphaerisporangium siamense]GII84244.1 baseplate protein [Sphaerisporangium siamense]